ncbi:MAG: DUF5667 domain-containing protein [Patescibacteria group bacterium]|nr:DUF5667 domain-containing protein [Patescibacteria group bacterium]
MKKIFFLITFFVILTLGATPVLAADTKAGGGSFDAIVTRIQESVEYFFTFKVEKKIELLEKYAEKRLTATEEHANKGENERVQATIKNYLQIKEKQNDLLNKDEIGDVLSKVQERTIDQQKTMEKIKTTVDEDTRQEMIQVQEQVVNQVAKKVVDKNKTEDRDVFLKKVEHVWAPGTEPGGETKNTYAPGTNVEGEKETTYAPGTGPGGNAEVVVEDGLIKFTPGTSGGGESGVKYEGRAGQQFAPGTSEGSRSEGGNSNSEIKNLKVIDD